MFACCPIEAPCQAHSARLPDGTPLKEAEQEPEPDDPVPYTLEASDQPIPYVLTPEGEAEAENEPEL